MFYRISKQNNSKMKNHVTYIMSSTYRVLDNYALYYALKNYKKIDVIVYRNDEEQTRNNKWINPHFKNLIMKLKTLPINEVIFSNDIVIGDTDYIFDEEYLNVGKRNLKMWSDLCRSKYTIIDSNTVVPVRHSSDKEEYSAATIRRKIWRLLDNYMIGCLEEYDVSIYENNALNHFAHFIENKLPHYGDRNHPGLDVSSQMSVYLKYGIISPVRMLIMLEDSKSLHKQSYIEELVIRRELAINFTFYNDMYDQFDKMTYNWSYLTMEIHKMDKREYLYTIEDYITFNTHDPYFNAAMKELVYNGTMHGYMRMYWCKKIIEWSPSFKKAYNNAIYLNNYYFYDGNTSNGYTGVAWCFGKHDRAWKERLVFGKLRYMNSNGLERKFDMKKYIMSVEEKVKKHE